MLWDQPRGRSGVSHLACPRPGEPGRGQRYSESYGGAKSGPAITAGHPGS